jgi:cold shock CspA family protein
VNLVTVRFYGTCLQFVKDSVPDVNIVLQEHADALNMIAKEKEEQLKKQLELEQRKAEAESRRKEVMAKIATVRALKSKQGTPLLSTRDNLRNLYQRRDRALKYINNRTRFDCIISRWGIKDCYGFGDIIVDDEIESVFVHGKSFSGKKVYNNLKKGSMVEFRIEWDLDKPRPKAVETTI